MSTEFSTVDTSIADTSIAESTETHWVIRRALAALERFRPAFGWLVLLICLWLAMTPALAADSNDWLEFRGGVRSGSGIGILLLGPLAVALTWAVLGWRRNGQNESGLRVATNVLVLMLAGLVALSQALTGWIPGLFRLLGALFSNSWLTLLSEMSGDLVDLLARVIRWQDGVAAGGATQDNMIFVAFVGGVIWIASCASAWLLRRDRSGLLSSLPLLLLLGMSIFYGSSGRSAFLVGLLLAIVLHMVLHHRALETRWDQTGFDYSGGIFGERLLYVFVAGAMLVGLAGIFPTISIDAISQRYFEFLAPINDQVEDFGVRLFPDLKVTSRFRGGSLADGLPNSFLLSAGPELSQREVMRVRTDEPYFYEPNFPGESLPPAGHYMRGGTLTIYDGLGWRNAEPDSVNNPREARVAESAVEDPVDEVVETVAEVADEQLPPGRKLLTQDIFLTFNSSALYAAPEPQRPFVDYRIERHANGDPLALWASSADRSLRSYTIASSIAAVSADQLAAEPMWNESTPLPAGHQLYLQLPDTVTDRTRDLAQTLRADLTEQELASPYAIATAIEAHLRTLPYDLSVTEPPADVTDVVDYFLFDLQRGYCDYYTSAFATLARLSGLPTRFATGFAVGRWNESDGMYVVTEAEAHSWPEVYFPTYGWIAFEPTAGRSELTRIGLPESITASSNIDSGAVVNEVAEEAADPFWSWQMLVWLIPMAALAWGLFSLWSRWRLRTVDPWLGLLRWGQRIGRPLAEGETVLEYGAGLADHTLVDLSNAQDAKRLVAREVQTLSGEMSAARYGPDEGRASAHDRAVARWRDLRGYLRQVG